MRTKYFVIITIIFATTEMVIFTGILAFVLIDVFDDPNSAIGWFCTLIGIIVIIVISLAPPFKLLYWFEKRELNKIHEKYGGEISSSFWKYKLKFDDFEIIFDLIDLYIEYYEPNIPDMYAWRWGRKNWKISVSGMNNDIENEYIEDIRDGLFLFYEEDFDVQNIRKLKNENVNVKLHNFVINDEKIIKFALEMKVLLELD
jgi:hypothetical protein